MIEGLISLASYGIVGGGAIGNILYDLENAGVFSYVLPFLMIFAIIYAILSKAGFLGENKAVNFIISIAVALMALQFQFVSYFFAEVFPRMGVVLSLLLVGMILLGLFVDFNGSAGKWGMGIFAGIALIVIFVQSFSEAFGWNGDLFGGGSWYWLEQYSTTIIIAVLVLGTVIAIPLMGKKKGVPKAS
ncbi:MAG: hypothetical protein NUV46_02070 [Nanoarchaeota archaeon]|nr:hypothetical protein [Nanoarchaeota archaeon]